MYFQETVFLSLLSFPLTLSAGSFSGNGMFWGRGTVDRPKLRRQSQIKGQQTGEPGTITNTSNLY